MVSESVWSKHEAYGAYNWAILQVEVGFNCLAT